MEKTPQTSSFHENEEYKVLKNLAVRPGMFVGANRLDYIERFLNGFLFYKREILKEESCWNSNYEMQRWLFYKESVSIAHGNVINGWSLMARCYGQEKRACEQFRAFMEETPYPADKGKSVPTVAEHIYRIYSYYFWEEKEIVSDVFLQEAINIIGTVNNSYESIIPFVKQMIPESYEDLLIYVHYETYFLQIRFLYYNQAKGWVDNTALVNQEHYYRDLIILHAYVLLVQKEEHPSHIVTIHSKQNEIVIETMEVADHWNAVLNHGADKRLCSQNPMSLSFFQWRNNIT